MLRFALSCAFLCLAIDGGMAQTTPAPVPKTDAPVTTKTLVVEEPRDIVIGLYKSAISDLKKNRPSPFFQAETRQKLFSTAFNRIVTQALDEAARDKSEAIDFDPITAAQDTDVKTVTVKTDLIDLGKAVISASFTNFKQPTVVTYDFVKDAGTWKIDDIKGTTNNEAGSVRKIFKGTGKEPTTLPGMKDANKSVTDEKPSEK